MRYDGCMKTAFSLVELSIVLVILGLLTGGILAGQSLIRASELRTISVDADKYTSAMHSFRDKYFALPGDMTNAGKFWGVWATSGTPESVTGAKDGNGDGAYGVSATYQYERVQFFRHLALAGLIEGNYAGSYAEPAIIYVAGVNLPRAKISDGRLGVNSVTSASATRVYNALGNYLITQGNATPYSLITPQETWNIDTKRDDGNPSLGAVMGIAEGAAASRNCTTNDNWETAPAGASTYKLDVSSKECWPLIWFR